MARVVSITGLRANSTTPIFHFAQTSFVKIHRSIPPSTNPATPSPIFSTSIVPSRLIHIFASHIISAGHQIGTKYRRDFSTSPSGFMPSCIVVPATLNTGRCEKSHRTSSGDCEASTPTSFINPRKSVGFLKCTTVLLRFPGISRNCP